MLLVMYGDEIVAWTKDLFSARKGVDEFNISLKEMTEIEKDGRAQMVRTRFELKSVLDEIKNFTGSKEQEKAKVEELNRKYGESFGYYQTLSEWYDTIRKKSEDYVQSLFLQMKVQSLVKKHQKSMIRLQRQRRRMKANLIHGGGMAERLTVSFLPTSPTNRIIMVAGKKRRNWNGCKKNTTVILVLLKILPKNVLNLIKGRNRRTYRPRTVR